MSAFFHSMKTRVEGIRATMPARWRSLDGIVGVHWQAEGQAGGRGYYLSPDPRIMLFFNDVADQIRVADRELELGRNDRGMARAIYVPAGTPMWTRFTARHHFSHLDIHMHQDRLMRFLAPTLGNSKARSVIRRPVELQDTGPVATLARLMVDELSGADRHPLFAETLAGSIATGLLDLPGPVEDEPQNGGRLTQAQMNRLTSHVASHNDQRLTVAEMAEVVGLSESWFATVFRQTTGKTPLQWQLSRRIASAQALLGDASLTIADIAAQLGFSDQAHLTKVFRQVVGETPAAWRRGRG